MHSAISLMSKVRKHFIPPIKLSISEWSEQNITISSGSNRGLKYDPSFMVYQNEILDCVNNPDIEKIVICASARIGKTFMVQNIMAYFMTHEPTSILYMRPTDSDINKFSKEEMASLIENTPALKEKIDARTETYDFKQYPGGSLRLIGSNSAGRLAGFGVRICLMDEIDKYSPIPGFGNPVDLAEERTAEYALFGRSIIYISTPTEKDEENKIDWLYEQKSDKRVYMVPCIHCGSEQELIFKNIKFQHCREKLDDIYYECSECGGHINDSQRLTMMRKGRWVSTRPEIKGFAGFKINRLYSPMATMESLVKDFLNKKDNVLMLRQFLNDALAEAWDNNRQIKASTNELYNRREHYISPIPFGVGFLTMAVDVQGNHDTDKSWLEYEVKGWGKDNENWSIEHDLILGNPAEKEIWNQLLLKINQTFLTYSGDFMPISICGIDTQGGFTKEVHEFLRKKAPKVIGLEGKKNKIDAKLRTNRRNKAGTWEVGSYSAKDTIFSILSVDKPGPNYCHFPDTLDEKYFLSLLSEKKVEQLVGGVKIKKYKKISVRNEGLDLFVYNWYLYNHLLHFQPSLMDASLKAMETSAKDEKEDQAESQGESQGENQAEQEGRVDQQKVVDISSPGLPSPAAPITSQEPSILVVQVPKRKPYSLPVLSPYRF